MTYQPDCTVSPALLDQIARAGLDAVPDRIRIIINTARQAERQHYLRAAPYARAPTRQGYANGYKPKTVTTRGGPITFAVPQVRDGSFYPQALAQGVRRERALTLALAEMYIQGVSTRTVAAMTEQRCGGTSSSTHGSRAAAQRAAVLQRWRSRPLGVTPYLYRDARYEQVRVDGHIRAGAVLIASGVDVHGKRQIGGVSVARSEHDVHWRTLLQSLVTRGRTGVQRSMSDAHLGLQAARKAIFGGVPWQRWHFHLPQNASAYVPCQALKAEGAADIRAIFNAPNRAEADALLARTVQKYATSAARLATWLESNIPAGLTVCAFPASQRRLIRTTNG